MEPRKTSTKQRISSLGIATPIPSVWLPIISAWSLYLRSPELQTRKVARWKSYRSKAYLKNVEQYQSLHSFLNSLCISLSIEARYCFKVYYKKDRARKICYHLYTEPNPRGVIPNRAHTRCTCNRRCMAHHTSSERPFLLLPPEQRNIAGIYSTLCASPPASPFRYQWRLPYPKL